MSKCALCGEEYKETDKGTIKVKRKQGICKSCTTSVIEGLFSNNEFDEWLIAFCIPDWSNIYPDTMSITFATRRHRALIARGLGLLRVMSARGADL